MTLQGLADFPGFRFVVVLLVAGLDSLGGVLSGATSVYPRPPSPGYPGSRIIYDDGLLVPDLSFEDVNRAGGATGREGAITKTPFPHISV
jgi:hypothetical protein